MGLYYAIWQKVKQLCPNALQRVELVMSDYERAAMTIARQIFPESRIIGCWFHFNQVEFLTKTESWKLFPILLLIYIEYFSCRLY